MKNKFWFLALKINRKVRISQVLVHWVTKLFEKGICVFKTWVL